MNAKIESMNDEHFSLIHSILSSGLCFILGIFTWHSMFIQRTRFIRFKFQNYYLWRWNRNWTMWTVNTEHPYNWIGSHKLQISMKCYKLCFMKIVNGKCNGIFEWPTITQFMSPEINILETIFSLHWYTEYENYCTQQHNR